MTVNQELQTAIIWGELVQIAYDMYEQDPISPRVPDDFPSDWKIVATMIVEPGIKFFHKKEFIGYIAQSIHDQSHHTVIFRGTESFMDWIADFEFILEPFQDVPNGGKTESGFTNAYRSITVRFVDQPSAAVPLSTTLDKLPKSASLTVAGHSLGGALATLHAVVAANRNIPVELVTFASPKVGDSTFVEAFRKGKINSKRIYNDPDKVPKVPPHLAGYEHVDEGIRINSLDFPVKHSIACYHSLNTYLYVMGSQKLTRCSCITDK